MRKSMAAARDKCDRRFGFFVQPLENKKKDNQEYNRNKGKIECGLSAEMLENIAGDE